MTFGYLCSFFSSLFTQDDFGGLLWHGFFLCFVFPPILSWIYLSRNVLAAYSGSVGALP